MKVRKILDTIKLFSELYYGTNHSLKGEEWLPQSSFLNTAMLTGDITVQIRAGNHRGQLKNSA